MKRVGITGIDGFLGWHLRAFLHGRPDIEVVGANRSIFADRQALARFVKSSDVIVHLAGMNRGDEKELVDTNIGLTGRLIEACEEARYSPHIVFSSSTQILLDNPYGNSKRRCTQMLEGWAGRSGAVFTNMILPNLFGEAGKPFHNSVVATFCYQIANGQKTEIIKDNNIELMHAQAVARGIYDIIMAPKAGDAKFSGKFVMVSDLLTKLKDFAEMYGRQVIPDLSRDFDLQLFNTMRYYLYPKHYPAELVLHRDNRGNLFEAVKACSGGKCFISKTKPGITRGNHYHTGKFERFLVIEGCASIRIRKLFSGAVVRFDVTGDRPQYIDIPTLHTHNITNTGAGDLITVFWKDVSYDGDGEDTFPEPVEEENEKT